MIPNQNTAAIEVESNIVGNKVRMGLHIDSTPHLMNVLTGLYSNIIRAVIREYSTNGLDAQIEAGYDGPIEIELPNQLKPLLIIRDHGVGLSEADITEIYSQYGASTKRGTDDQQGCLGLGCKSALAYAQQFTLVSVKDHKRTTVVIAREEDGGSMTIVSTIDTTEPNGTEITIPVDPSDAYRFGEEAAFIFSFWDEGTALVDGEAPARISGLDISDEIKLIEGSQDYIVMGGVAYPTTLKTGLNNRGIAVWVPMGSVAFPAPRESLEENDRATKECKRAIEEAFAHHIDSTVQRAIDACQTKDEAVRTMIEWDRLMPRSVQSVNYTFQGESMPINLTSPDTMFTAEVHLGWKAKVGRHAKDRMIYAAQWADTFWITGYDKEYFTATTRKKIDKYLYDHPSLTSSAFKYLTCVKGDLEIAPWVNPDHVVEWKTEIEPIKLPRRGRAADPNRITGSYDMYVCSAGKVDYETGIPAEDIVTTYPLFYAHPTTSNPNALAKFVPDFTLVELADNREAKFKRNFPMAKQSHTECNRLRKEWKAKNIRPSDELAATIQDRLYYQDANTIKKMEATKLDDPELRRTIRMLKRDVSKIVEKARKHGVSLNATPWVNPFANDAVYPLFSSGAPTEHLYMYLNVAYAASKENK